MEWRPVVGFEGRYEVSAGGRLRSIRLGGRSRLSGRVVRAGLVGNGYLYPSLCRPHGVVVKRYLHALVAEAFLGRRPDGWVINHRNGKRTDNRAKNLEYVTQRENVWHAAIVLGRKLGAPPRLTARQVRSIRALCGTASQSVIAKRFGVSRANVGAILTRLTWRHI